MAFDVGPPFRQQRFGDLAGGLAVRQMLGIGRPVAKRLLQERYAQPFGAANRFQFVRRPRPILEHLRKQGQSHADHAAVLRQTVDGGRKKRLLLC